MAQAVQDRMPDSAHGPLLKKLDGIAWGLFFIWVGIAFLANLGWGIGLLGVGAITLGTQGARRYFGFALERFWIAMGVVFSAWGTLELLDVGLRAASIPGGAIPLLFIAVGAVFITRALLHKR